MSIDQLEEYFSSIELPEAIHLDECTYCTNVKKLIESNIAILRAHSGNMRYKPYYDQLMELKERIEQLKE